MTSKPDLPIEGTVIQPQTITAVFNEEGETGPSGPPHSTLLDYFATKLCYVDRFTVAAGLQFDKPIFEIDLLSLDTHIKSVNGPGFNIRGYDLLSSLSSSFNANLAVSLFAIKPETSEGQLRVLYKPPSTSQLATDFVLQKETSIIWDYGAETALQFPIPGFCTANERPTYLRSPGLQSVKDVEPHVPIADFRFGTLSIHPVTDYQFPTMFPDKFEVLVFIGLENPIFYSYSQHLNLADLWSSKKHTT